MSTISNWLPQPPNNFSTTLSSGISATDLTIPLNSVSGLPTEGIGVIYRKDTDGKPIASSIEFIHWTGVGSNTLTLTDTGDRGISGSASGAQAHNAGDTFEVWVHSSYYGGQRTAFLTEHNDAGTHKDITAISVSTDTISEKTADAGVTIDGVKLKDSQAYTDQINEKTTDAGVTVDGLLIKDGAPANWDGWMPANETWTYASATTFTVSGDVTAKYPKGTKIKLTQTTTKYFYVIGTSYSAPNTTVTITGGSDYSLANAAITNNYYSYQATPHGFPIWFNYTPTYDAFGSMTYTSVTTDFCKFVVIGPMVIFKLFAVGITGGTASTAIGFTVPINMTTNGKCACSGAAINDGAIRSAVVWWRNTSNSLWILKYDNSNFALGTVWISAQVIYEMA